MTQQPHSKTGIFLALLFFLVTASNLSAEEIIQTKDGKSIVLYDDHTWQEAPAGVGESQTALIKKYKSQLRKGVQASDAQIAEACEMLSQGWTFQMPIPKSAQAAWGNGDRRTTWFNGYWQNGQTHLFSGKTPTKSDSGLYLGDNQNNSNTWRNGGSPGAPDVYMFLLSTSGGPRA